MLCALQARRRARVLASLDFENHENGFESFFKLVHTFGRENDPRSRFARVGRVS